MDWWFVYGNRFHQLYQDDRLREAEKEALAASARGQTDTRPRFLDLLALALAFVNFHIR